MKRQLLAGVSALLWVAYASAACAADDADTTVDEVIIVARDKAGLLEKKPSNTVFGIDKPLIETPRSASFVSATTLERYGVETIDDLTAVSPGAFTASFYGVSGALNVRGTLAENYYRGFKRIENRGTYSTPIGNAAQIEIVRGPPTPIYGSGKVGGQLNFTPKSALGVTSPEGELTATGGSYGKAAFSGQGTLPLTLGAFSGGVHGYIEWEDSGEYYRGISPERTLGELSAAFDLGGGWSTEFGASIFRSEGDVQTPGWNRLTQDLIDKQIYITGRDTSKVDSDGNGRLTPNEVGFYPFGTSLYNAYYGFTPAPDATHTLDVGVGTAKLDRRTVYTSDADFSETETNTYYFDLVKDFDGGQSLKLQLFYDDQENKRFVSYGYPAWFDSSVWEARATYNFDYDAGMVTTKSFVGASYRSFEGRRRESYNSGLIALDRRDIVFGATPTDIIDSPFSVETGPGIQGLEWENDNSSEWTQAGLFFTSDIWIGERLNLMLGGRYDDYDVTSEDTGFLSYTIAGEQTAGKGMGSYSASLSYKTPWGVMPYITYAESSALEMSQAGDIAPSLVENGGWLSDSDLTEGGLKYSGLNGTLIASLAVYRQNRTRLTQGIGTTAVQGTLSKGVELEVRWLATENLSFTLAANNQRTDVKGPDTSFAYIPASAVGATPANAFGGTYVVWAFNTLPGRDGSYKYSLMPDAVVSLFATYTTDDYEWGKAGGTLGFTTVSETSGTLMNPVVLPGYTVVNASGFFEKGPYTVTANIDNLFDELYFTPVADSYANLAALPGRGREWRVTLKRTF